MLIEHLQPLTVSLVVVESTGGLEQLVCSGLQASEIPVAMVNPRRVKGFAIAMGKAKTDKLDAQVLAHFAHSIAPRPQEPVSPKGRAGK